MKAYKQLELSPAEGEMLSQSLLAVLRLATVRNDDGGVRDGDRDCYVPVFDLLAKMLPDEECIAAYLKRVGDTY